MRCLVATVFTAAALSADVAHKASGADSPDDLPLIGRARVSAIYDIEAAPPYAYALERGVLRVLDVHNPGAVREVAALEFARPRVRLSLRPPYLYLTGFQQPLGIVDVSEPMHPRWLADSEELTTTANDGFELAGNVAYVVRGGATPGGEYPLVLDVIDLETTPAKPRRVASLELGVRVLGEYGGIAHADGRVFVLVSSPVGAVSRSQLIVVDARSADRPRIERSIALPEGRVFRDVEVRGDLLYFLQSRAGSVDRTGLLICRLGAEEQLEVLGEVATPGLRFPIDLIVRGDLVYATYKVGALAVVFHVGNPRAPTVMTTYAQQDLLSAGLGMTLVGNWLYVAGDNGPSPIFDISSAPALKLLGRYEFDGGLVTDVAVTEGRVAVLESLNDLLFYDVSNPRAPRRLARHKSDPSYDPALWQCSLVFAASGPRVLAAYETRPAELIDASDAEHPRVLGRFTPRGIVRAVTLGHAHAFLGYQGARAPDAPCTPPSEPGHFGIQIVDLRDPAGLRALADVTLDRAVSALAHSDPHLVVLHVDGSLTLLNLDDPARPAVVGRLATTEAPGAGQPFSSPRLALSSDGRTAYTVLNVGPREGDHGSRGRGVLRIVDLRDPAMPRVRGRIDFETSGVPELSLAVSGTRIVIVAGDAGDLVVVDAEDLDQPWIVSRMPAPPLHVRTAAATDGRHVFLAAGEDGLLVYGLPGTAQ